MNAIAQPHQTFTRTQGEVIRLLQAGADVRAWDLDHRSLLPLIHRGAVECEATTNRLYLLTPEVRDRRRETLRRMIQAHEIEVDQLADAIDASVDALADAHLRLSLEETNVVNLARALAAAAGQATATALGRELATARSELFAAREDYRQQLSADRSRRRRLDEVSGHLRELRRELARLDLRVTR